MTTSQTIFRNTFWYGVITAAGLVAGVLMSVVLARGLGPARMGDYSYLLWLLRTMTALATLGYALATVRYTADALAQGDQFRAGAFLRLFLRRQILTTTAVVALLVPVILWAAPADLRWALVVVAIGLFPTTVEAIYASGAYGAQRYDLTTQVSAVKMTLHLMSAIVAMALGADILGLVIGGTLGTTISCALQRRQARGLYPESGGTIPEGARAELRAYLLPLSIVAVLDTIVWDRSEVLFLRLYASSEEIAFYSVAFGLATRSMVVPQVLGGALLPALAALHGRGDTQEFARLYRGAIRAVTLVGTPLTLIGAALAPGLITLLYGEPYRPVAALLGPLLAVALVGVMRQVAWTALRAIGDRHRALHATWISAVVNVAAALVLIPQYGTWGAVIANASAQLTASALAFVAIAGRTRCGFPVLDVLRIGIAGAAGLFATRAVTAAGSSALGDLAVAGAVGLAAFVAAALFVGAVGPREWKLVLRTARALPSWVRVAMLLLLGLTALGALYATVMRDLVEVWATVPYYSYGFLVPVFSAYATWEARRSLAGARPAWSPAGLGLAAAGVTLFVAGMATASLTLKAISLPLVLAGLGVLGLGRERFGAIGFPIAFLVFMAPLPDAAIPALSLPLQHLAAWVAEHALPALGIPVVRDGLFVHLPRVTMEISEACNGLRFLLAMLVLGTVFAWTTQRGAARRVTVVAIAAALAIAANLVRVTGTGWLAHYYGPEAASGFFHIAYGKVVYGVMLAPFVVAVLLLRRPARLSSPGHGR